MVILKSYDIKSLLQNMEDRVISEIEVEYASKWSLPNFALNIERIWANQLTFIRLDINRKP